MKGHSIDAIFMKNVHFYVEKFVRRFWILYHTMNLTSGKTVRDWEFEFFHALLRLECPSFGKLPVMENDVEIQQNIP